MSERNEIDEIIRSRTPEDWADLVWSRLTTEERVCFAYMLDLSSLSERFENRVAARSEESAFQNQVRIEEELVAIAQRVIAENPKQVEQYKSGKTTLGFFVGRAHIIGIAMGTDPKAVYSVFKKLLEA